MKIRMHCAVCLKLNGKSSECPSMEVEDTGVYDVTCSLEHNSMVCVPNQKFEILFDFGGMALLDGYTREAVANFASSLERFHEFCIRVFVNASHISEELFNETWRPVKKRSECQLGAFCFLYLSACKEIPPKFIRDTKNSEFRNDVLHNGYIPKFTEAFDYGKKVFEYISTVLLKIRNGLSSSIDEVCTQILVEQNRQAMSIERATDALPTMINLTIINPEKSFEKSLGNLKKYRKMVYDSCAEIAAEVVELQ